MLSFTLLLLSIVQKEIVAKGCKRATEPDVTWTSIVESGCNVKQPFPLATKVRDDNSYLFADRQPSISKSSL